MLDVEMCQNNRPHGYVEDDHELPVLIPNALITGQPVVLTVKEEESAEGEKMKRRAKHDLKSKRLMWERWMRNISGL